MRLTNVTSPYGHNGRCLLIRIVFKIIERNCIFFKVTYIGERRNTSKCIICNDFVEIVMISVRLFEYLILYVKMSFIKIFLNFNGFLR